MTNFRKSFNFRSGLQVDEDNFVVSPDGAVGIGTSIPIGHVLDVRGDISVSGFVTSANLYTSNTASVGFLTASNAYAGILTVNQLRVGTSGLVDNLVGYAYTGWVTTNPVGLTTTARVGIGTDVIPDEQLKVDGNVSVVGILTATSFNGSGASLTNIPNSATTATNANTASAIVARDASGNFSAGTITATLNGSSSSASALTGSPSITVTDVSASNVSSGVVTATTELNVGTGGNALTALSTGRLGIGTALPTSEIQIRKASGSFLQVVSDSGEARISVGNSLDAGKSTGVIRFGNSANDLDIINNDNEGDINFLLNGNGAAGSGKFSWQDGSTFNEVMSLDANGNFSVSGVTTLASASGITTTGGDLYIGNNLYVKGSVNGTFALPNIFEGNVYTSSGISTFNDLKVGGDLLVESGYKIGIGTIVARQGIDAENETLIIANIGIGTTGLYQDPDTLIIPALQLIDKSALLQSSSVYFTSEEDNLFTVGFNTFDARSVIDCGNVGAASTLAGYFIPPSISTADRDLNSNFTGIGGTIEGAIIFNTTTKKHQGYDGTQWNDLY